MMRKFEKRIFIAKPEGKDGIEKAKVKLLDADSKRIGERDRGDRLKMGMNRGGPGPTLGFWAGGECEQGSMF